MWENVLSEIMRHHRGKFLGILFGLIFAVLVISFGFLQTIFIACCIYIGYIIGKRLDDNESLKDVMERLFRER